MGFSEWARKGTYSKAAGLGVNRQGSAEGSGEEPLEESPTLLDGAVTPALSPCSLPLAGSRLPPSGHYVYCRASVQASGRREEPPLTIFLTPILPSPLYFLRPLRDKMKAEW